VLDRKAAALAQLMTLGMQFPQLRPRTEPFARWAERVAANDLAAPPLDEGFSLLDSSELARIEGEHAKQHPSAWRSLVDDLGDDETARQALVRGAVVAGVWERRPLEDEAVGVLEDWPEEDAAEALALVLDPTDLWSVAESDAAESVLAELDDKLDDDAYESAWEAVVAQQAQALATAWHDARLRELVGRWRSRLPLDDFPVATSSLAAACEAFERDSSVRTRLAGLLLSDSLGRLRLQLGLPVAA
jgi:hypothetical protein